MSSSTSSTRPQQHPVIKLALEESGDSGPFRRIVFTKQHDDATLLESLKARAVELKTGQSIVGSVAPHHYHARGLQQYDVQLTYKDVDGDPCVLLSNADVLDALLQYEDGADAADQAESGSSSNNKKRAVKIWCKVSHKRLMKQQQQQQKVATSRAAVASTATMASVPVSTAGTQTTAASSGAPKTATSGATSATTAVAAAASTYQGGAPVPFHQLVESLVGILATALVALQGQLCQAGMLVEPKHTNLATIGNGNSNSSSSSSTTAVPKEEKEETAKKSRCPRGVAPLSTRIPLTDVHMGSPCVTAAPAGVPKAAAAAPKDLAKEAPKAAPVAVAAAKSSKPEEVESRPFIHGRHTCDVCLTTPIIGGRFHAINLPDYDMCQACHSNYKGKEIVFEKVQLDRDMPFQDRWHRRYNKWGTTGRPHFRKHGRHHHCGGPRGAGGGRRLGAGPAVVATMPTPAPSAPPASQEEAKPEQIDAALKEAIRRSMLDVNTKKAEPGVAAAAAASVASASKPAAGRLSVSSKQSTASTKSTNSVEKSVEEVVDEVAQKVDLVAAKVAESTKKVAEVVASEEFAQSLDEVVNKVTESVKMVAEKVDEAVKEHQVAVNKQKIAKKAKAVSPPKIEPPVEKVIVDEPKLKVEAELSVKPAPVESVTEIAKPKTAEDAKPAAVENLAAHEENATEEEIVVPPTVSTVANPTLASTSFELDAAGNGDVAADLGATMDKIVTAIHALENELDRSSEQEEDSESVSLVDGHNGVGDGTNTNNEDGATANGTRGATILSGEETKDDDSNASWMVVNDQVTSDEALARAAQVIGSALFNSDMKSSTSENISAMSHSQGSNSSASASESSDSSNSQVSSVGSVPTTLPSIASAPASAGVARVLLDRWTIQLSQLHELGFFDDAQNVEILERLQAANVGSGEEEEVTVTQVINELMRE